MLNILIVYASKYGQCEKIALKMAEDIREMNHHVETWDIQHIPALTKVEDYDGIIIGGSVHSSHYSDKLSNWISSHSTQLRLKPTAFYSVCLGILQNDATVYKDEDNIIQNLFIKTGWDATYKIIFPGALAYSKYNWFTKRIMHSIAKKAGVETDMRKDYEYTDWNQVRQFTKNFVKSL